MTYYSALHYATKAEAAAQAAEAAASSIDVDSLGSSLDYSNSILALENAQGTVLSSVVIKTGASWEVGDVGISAFGIDETQNRRRYLNGQVISQAQFESFTDKLKSIVALYPNLATTDENWQAEVTNSALGQCGKFVIDDVAGTIRLPKVVNINGLQDLTGLGGIKAESLPNITGQINAGTGDPRGAFYNTGSSGGTTTPGGVYSLGYIGFDASRSSSTYQDNAPVQQEAVQYPYFIQVAEGVETSVDVSREIELNNPFSLLDYKYSEYELSNASWLLSNGQWNSGAVYQSVYDLLLQIYNGTVTKAGVSVKLSTEAYADTDFVLNTGDTTFRLPVKVLMAGSKRVAGNGMTLGLDDGTLKYGIVKSHTNGTRYVSGYTNLYGAATGTMGIDDGINSARGAGITTDPTKSGIETSANGLYLYFYVGETVQDANIIAAAGVLTDVAGLKAHSIVETYVNGTSWYRIYSDGWCEQGGEYNKPAVGAVTISLLKAFIDTSYTVNMSGFYTGGQIGSIDGLYAKSVNNFTVMSNNEATNYWVVWRACGYIS